MSNNYYKKINNIDYDSKLLEKADELISGKGDGRISADDTEILIKYIFDRGTITNVEHRTIYYILNNFKFTETGLKNLLYKLQIY